MNKLREEVHNKLVRDKVPENIVAFGNKPITRVAELEEFKDLLIKKLGEEVEEFVSTSDIGELGDVYDVLDALANVLDEGGESLKLERKKKDDRYGQFNDRIILEKVNVFKDYDDKNR